MSNVLLKTVLGMALIGSASWATAQEQGEGRRGGRAQEGRRAAEDGPSQSEMTRWTMLMMPEVQDALGLSEESAATVEEAMAALRPQRGPGGRGGAGGRGGGQGGGRGGDGGDGGAGTETADNSEAAMKRAASLQTMRSLLDDEQKSRLNGIFIQVMKGRALADEEIAKALKLTEEQIESVQAAVREGMQEMAAAMQELRSSGEVDREAMMETMQDVMSEVNEKLLAVLTPEQTTAMEEMEGEKVEISEQASRRMMMMGAGRGGAGGQGGRGGAGGRGGQGGGRGGDGGGL